MNVLIQQYLWEYIVAYCLNVLSISITSFNAIHQKNKKHHHDKDMDRQLASEDSHLVGFCELNAILQTQQ